MNNPYVLFVYHGDLHRDLFAANARDNCTEPMLQLKSALEELGYTVEAASRRALPECAWLLFWDESSVEYSHGLKGMCRRLRYGDRARNWLREASRAGLDRIALLSIEPPAVNPRNQSPTRYRQFPVVFSWNDRLVDGQRVHKMFLPMPVRTPPVEPRPFATKKLLVNISGNKMSNYPHELYSARLAAIEHFETARAPDFDLYGVGWDAERHPCYKGTVPHKAEVFPQYKFALCYENCSDQLGYITEKLFDCMRADCVPVYWGAPNIGDYVDPEAFIDRREFESNQELEAYLDSVDVVRYTRFKKAIEDYLAGDSFKVFLAPHFVQTIVDTLGLRSAGRMKLAERLS
jgi:hypothetical protein